jgi:hypothetical protein
MTTGDRLPAIRHSFRRWPRWMFRLCPEGRRALWERRGVVRQSLSYVCVLRQRQTAPFERLLHCCVVLGCHRILAKITRPSNAHTLPLTTSGAEIPIVAEKAPLDAFRLPQGVLNRLVMIIHDTPGSLADTARTVPSPAHLVMYLNNKRDGKSTSVLSNIGGPAQTPSPPRHSGPFDGAIARHIEEGTT